LDTIKKEVLKIVRKAYDMGKMSDNEVLSQKPWQDWDTNPEELTQYITDRFGLDIAFLDGETYKKIEDIIPVIDKVWDGVTLNNIPEIELSDIIVAKKKEYVNHPVYGNQPIKSGNSYSADDIIDACWVYSDQKIFTETAIPGDISMQKYGDNGERTLFVDVGMTCPRCKRDFIFFAKEHKHLTEILGVITRLGPYFCFECRGDLESVKDAMKVYTDILPVYPRTNEQQEAFDAASTLLFEAGYHGWA
jgi:hypothetical protein